MIKKNIIASFVLVMSIVSTFIASNTLNATELTNNPKGVWSANIEGIGKIALSCRRKSSIADCQLFWIFKEIPVFAKTNKDTLKIFIDKTAEDYILISLKDGEPHSFLKSSIITSKYISHYSSAHFKKISAGDYADIAEYKRSKSEYNKYHEKGRLIKLPRSLPDWIINPSAYLLKSKRVHGLPRILEHPNMSSETLKVMYQYIRNNKDSSKQDLNPIARNPKTSKEVLALLFNEVPKSNRHNYMSTLNAVSNNPNSPANYKKQYLRMIKNGDAKIWNMVTKDRYASGEILDWIARRNEKKVPKRNIYFNKNTWSETLEYITEQPISEEDLRHLVDNDNLNSKSLIKLAKKKYKSIHEQGMILETITKKKSEEARQIALTRLAEDKDISHRAFAAKNIHIPKKLIARFVNSVSIRVRQAIAGNTVLGSRELITLAKDDYSQVAKPARENLKNRFKNKYEKIAPSLVPLSKLNPAPSLNSELYLATKNNDISHAKEVIKKYKTIRQPPYNIELNQVFANNNKELAKLLFEVSNQKLKHLLKKKEFNADWLEYLLSIKAFNNTNEFEILSLCVKLKRTDYLDLLLKYSYDINAVDKHERQSLLHLAVYLRDKNMLKYLLKKGIDKNIYNRRKQTPASFANQINFIEGVELLDQKNIFNESINQFKKKYTPDLSSRLVGKWSNLEGEFKTSVLHFNNDGSGKILGAVTNMLIVWKKIDSSNIEIIPNINGKLETLKKFSLKYKIIDDELEILGKKNRRKYHRLFDITATDFLKQKNQKRDLKYVGIWSNKKTKTTIQINPNGTAVYNKDKTYLWKNGEGKYIVLIPIEGEKIISGQSLKLEQNIQKDVLVIKNNDYSIIFTRKK